MPIRCAGGGHSAGPAHRSLGGDRYAAAARRQPDSAGKRPGCTERSRDSAAPVRSARWWKLSADTASRWVVVVRWLPGMNAGGNPTTGPVVAMTTTQDEPV